VIVVDTSAVLAIYLGEDDAARYAEAIERDDAPTMSTASVLECSIVVRARKAEGDAAAEQWLDDFIQVSRIDVRDVDRPQLAIARTAHQTYGKGTGHGAALNFGDCFSYALAKSLDVPLLFKGADFSRTDIRPALT
jgi:ribonuclease VapC